nr:cold-regulated 413 inner membrane protein 2, chloroplastic-like isoform X1 [Ipomoea trifida]
MLTLSLSYPSRSSLYSNALLSLKSPPPFHRPTLSRFSSQSPSLQSSAFLGYKFNPLSVSVDLKGGMNKRLRSGVVCYSAALTPRNLHWVCTVSSVGEYGFWTAFLALLIRLFFFFPGELELPFIALLMVIVSPYQVSNLRGTKEGVVLSLLISAYLAFQHFSRIGSLRKAFDQGSIIATLAILCIVVVPWLLLI